MTDLPRPSLTLVTDRTLFRPRSDKRGGPLSLVEEAVAGGVDIVQLRARNASADDLGLYAVALRLREMTAGQALFVVTGDVHLAEKSQADGLLLPERSYKPSEARSFLRGVATPPPAADEAPTPPTLPGGGVRLVGAFSRTVPAAARAERGGADYVQVGPIFDHDKDADPGEADAGLALLRKVKDAVQVPVVAFGGITSPRQIADCLRAGADGVAVTDAITRAPDPRAAAHVLRAALDAAWHALHGE